MKAISFEQKGSQVLIRETIMDNFIDKVVSCDSSTV